MPVPALDAARLEGAAEQAGPAVARCRHLCLRNIVERCFNKLKNARRLATHYNKTVSTYLGCIHIAATVPKALVDKSAARQVYPPAVIRVFDENLAVNGVRKVWQQMAREGFFCCRLRRRTNDAVYVIGRCQSWQACAHHIQRTGRLCPLDHVNRHFYAPASPCSGCRILSMFRHGPVSYMCVRDRCERPPNRG